jgi:hypothetical protein
MICGWQVQSEILLEGIRALPEVSAPDFVLELGALAPQSGTGTAFGPVLERLPDGSLLFDPPEIARALIFGNRVIVEARADATPGELQAFVLGPVLVLLGHVREYLPLHASCVELPRGAAAFSGPARAGKSSLAAGLAQRGHALVAEDVCVVAPGPMQPLVFASTSLVKLTRRSERQLKPEEAQVRIGHKRFFSMPPRDSAQSAPLDALYFLEHNGSKDAPCIRPIPANQVLAQVHGAILMPAAAIALRGDAALFAAAAKLAAAVRVARLVWPFDLARIDQTLDLIEGACETGSGAV